MSDVHEEIPVQPTPQAFVNPVSGPQRIEGPNDPLFQDEQDFQYKIETPAILRQTQERVSTLQTATATMEYTPMYEVANDLSEFFSDLAD